MALVGSLNGNRINRGPEQRSLFSRADRTPVKDKCLLVAAGAIKTLQEVSPCNLAAVVIPALQTNSLDENSDEGNAFLATTVALYCSVHPSVVFRGVQAVRSGVGILCGSEDDKVLAMDNFRRSENGISKQDIAILMSGSFTLGLLAATEDLDESTISATSALCLFLTSFIESPIFR